MEKWSFYKAILFLILFIWLPLLCFSQNDEVGNWLMYFGQNRLSDKWSIHSEIQYRSYTISADKPEQILIRTGLNYHLTDRAMLSAGYAYIPNYHFIPSDFEPDVVEHRIWQQHIQKNNIGRAVFEHRYRFEQRWINDKFRTRFRYRLLTLVPLNNFELEKGTFFLSLYDEIFINNSPDFFDRNRFYAALGYQLSKTTSLQLGMLHQQVSSLGKWHAQLAFMFNPDFRKSEK